MMQEHKRLQENLSTGKIIIFCYQLYGCIESVAIHWGKTMLEFGLTQEYNTFFNSTKNPHFYLSRVKTLMLNYLKFNDINMLSCEYVLLLPHTSHIVRKRYKNETRSPRALTVT